MDMYAKNPPRGADFWVKLSALRRLFISSFCGLSSSLLLSFSPFSSLAFSSRLSSLLLSSSLAFSLQSFSCGLSSSLLLSSYALFSFLLAWFSPPFFFVLILHTAHMQKTKRKMMICEHGD